MQMAPSFYKILLDPSAPHLSLPSDFVRMKKIPNAAIIKSANGGYLWKLKIKKIGDGYCFAEGWNNVVRDIRLGFGDFLLFRLLHKSAFKMSIYCPDGCEKILHPKVEHDGGCSFDDQDDDPFFTPILTKSYKNRLRLPAAFARSAGIDDEGTMTLKNHDGREWVIGLKLDASYRTKRYVLSSGWGRFFRENELSLGDECVFKFIRSEGKLLLAKVTKNKWLKFG